MEGEIEVERVIKLEAEAAMEFEYLRKLLEI